MSKPVVLNFYDLKAPDSPKQYSKDIVYIFFLFLHVKLLHWSKLLFYIK